MITARRTRLIRVQDLVGLQEAAFAAACQGTPAEIRSSVVIVPTRAAAAQLRRSFENRLLTASPARPGGGAALWPDLSTRDEWYRRMHERLGLTPPMLSSLEREVIAAAAGREAVAAGCAPPFRLRPALVGEILEFYDTLGRHRRTVHDFERLMTGDLEPRVDADRGAERLLRQTRFFTALFRAYERRVEASGGLDEGGLRRRLLDATATTFYRRVVVTVGDRLSDPAGLYAADFDLLTRLPNVEAIDVVATGEALAAGFAERLREELPGIEERAFAAQTDARHGPALLTPARPDAAFCFISRDREEELSEVARAIKRARRGGDAVGPDRIAVVFRRPLPYVYLAQAVFGAAGIPYEAADALPLAAEPFTAALDLLFDAVTSGFTRETLVAVLRCPHLAIEIDGRAITPGEIAALDRALADESFLGDRAHLERIAGQLPGPAARAGRAALELLDQLSPLAGPARASAHLDRLRETLGGLERPPAAGDPALERHLRARAALVATLSELADAHRSHDDPIVAPAELFATVRRWIEAQTFTPRAGPGGVQLVDAQAARYADVDEVFIVGLVEGEWPEGTRRSIFYPPFLLAQLGWPPERARLPEARAAFRDLLRLGRRRVSVSAFTLEDDAIVGLSPFIDDLGSSGLVVRPVEPEPRPFRVLAEEALTGDPLRIDILTGPAARWAVARTCRPISGDARFHGGTGSYSQRAFKVTAVDRYLECPFRFFAADVLGLGEDPEDSAGMSPKAEGRFVHDVLRAFFDEWRRAGHGAITPDTLDRARAMFRQAAERLLTTLAGPDAVLMRARLLGTPVASGVGEKVCVIEASRDDPLVDRLLEVALDGEFSLAGAEGARTLPLTGRADRIDVMAGGRLRLIDYKLGRAPYVRHSIQLPVYAACAEQRLTEIRREQCQVDDAFYVALGDRDAVKGLVREGGDLREALAEGQRRFVGAVDGIERGSFPPRPFDPRICRTCAYPAVCRKEYVGVDDPDPNE